MPLKVMKIMHDNNIRLIDVIRRVMSYLIKICGRG